MTSALDPLKVKTELWERADVCRALEQRDIGALFRLLRRYAGASQHRIGTATELQQGTVCKVMNGERVVTSIDVLERVADGLRMPDHARMRLGLAPKEDPMKRRTALGLSLIGTLSPAAVAGVLREASAEAFEFTAKRAALGVGKSTLDHLTAVIIELDRAYPWRPAAELLPIARVYRQRVESLIDGKHTLAEGRELYVHGAYLSYILADLAYDLGSTMTAKAYAIDSQQLANLAGHDELFAWAADTMASVLQNGAAGDAVKVALNGLTRAPRHHPLAPRLRVRAARGYAQLGNRAACTELLTEARQISEQLPDEMPSRFGTDSAEHTTYTIATHTATCHVTLGDWKQAEQQARAARGVARWSPGRAAYAQLDLGLALAHLGSPDEAAEHGHQALSLGRGYGSLLPRAAKLDTALRARYPKHPGTLEFRARYEELAAQAATN